MQCREWGCSRWRIRSLGSLNSGVLFLGMANSSEAAQTAPIMSPCRSVCKMSTVTGLCIGCLRTLDEIAAWGQMSPEERAAVMREITQRQSAHSHEQAS